MTLDVLIVALLGILVGLGWRRHAIQANELPRELRTAPLIYAECLFRSVGAVSITAKVDRVYRNADGALVLLELKTRRANRVYRSDVIELSAQRVALMEETGASVAEHAYVLIQLTERRRPTWHRVQILESGAVRALASRREALLVGEAEAGCCLSPGMCRTCGFRPDCRPEASGFMRT